MIKRIIYSLTFRLAFMFSLSAFAVLLLLGFAVLYAVNQHFISQDRMMLNAQSQHIVHQLHDISNVNDLSKQLSPTSSSALSEHGFMIFILDDHNHLLFSSMPNNTSIDLPAMIQATQNNALTSCHEATNSYRLLSQTISLADKPVTLVIALNINHHEVFLADFKYSIWFSIAIAALLMGLLACIVAKRGLKPLHILMKQTAQITVNNLSQRLPVSQTYSEISQLTLTFNEMLQRLEQAFIRLVGFSSDLAHELRTPLSTMKMQNQVTLSRPRSIEEYQHALQDNAESVEQLTRIVTDILFLAKSDNGLISPETKSFELHDEIASLCDFYDYLAQEKNITLELSGHAMLLGDKHLLQRAFSNLIINAITYGDTHSTVNIVITKLDNQIQITVQNQSNTIDSKHLPHLFERFYRVDSARTNSAEGAGLGLAITASIIQAHQGSITVTSSDRITCFTVLLPIKNY